MCALGSDKSVKDLPLLHRINVGERMGWARRRSWGTVCTVVGSRDGDIADML